MALFGYMQDMQRYLKDQRQQVYNPDDLIGWINQARTRIAAECQCIRVLPPSSGSLNTLLPLTGGSGYATPPIVTISAPDAVSSSTLVQATATAVLTAGVVTSFTITNAGTGYVNVPTVTLSGGGGSGATASATLTAAVVTAVGQEVYPFSAVNSIIQANFPGVHNIIGVQSISISWGAEKPMMSQSSFSELQAYGRSQNIGLQNYPIRFAQYGQGTQGSVYLWPVPSIVTQMDWDCYCLPENLTDDTSTEAVPYPYTDAIAHYATYFALLGDARGDKRDDAQYFLAEAKRMMREGRVYSSPAMVPEPYSYS